MGCRMVLPPEAEGCSLKTKKKSPKKTISIFPEFQMFLAHRTVTV